MRRNAEIATALRRLLSLISTQKIQASIKTSRLKHHVKDGGIGGSPCQEQGLASAVVHPACIFSPLSSAGLLSDLVIYQIMLSFMCNAQWMVFNTFGPIAFAVELSHGWSDTTLAMMAAVGSASFIGRTDSALFIAGKTFSLCFYFPPQPPLCLYCGSCRARICETLCCSTRYSSWDENFANGRSLKVYIKPTHHCGIQ